MMSVLMLLAGIALGVTLLNPRRRSDSGGAPPIDRKVTKIEVMVERPGGSGPHKDAPTIVVKPWTARVQEGDDITFHFRKGHTADRMLIVPKADWPLDQPLPGEQPPDEQNPVPFGQVKKGAKRPKPYEYDVLLKIHGLGPGPGNSAAWIRIDPELIVVWDTGGSKS